MRVSDLFRHRTVRAGHQKANENTITNNDDEEPMSSITAALLKLIQFASRETRGSKGVVMRNSPGWLNPVRRNRNTMVRRVRLLIYRQEDLRNRLEGPEFVVRVGD